jgi:hypothetical protein
MQVRAMIAMARIALKIICHSSVTGTGRQRVTLRGPGWWASTSNPPSTGPRKPQHRVPIRGRGRPSAHQGASPGHPGNLTRGRARAHDQRCRGLARQDLPAPTAGTDAREAIWEPVQDILARETDLAFDHSVILREALERARSQLEYTTVAAAFCPEPFTIADLRYVYEAIWGLPLDPSNFRRKVTKAERFVEPTGEQRLPNLGRPAALYRRGTERLLSPPLMRNADIDRPPDTRAATLQA